MKVWYLINNNSLDYIVAYGNTPEDAFKRFLNSRRELIKSHGIDTDITNWEIEEFTPDLYDGVLFFF